MKPNKQLLSIFIFAIIITACILAAYLYKFNGPLSSHKDDWIAFGTYIGGTIGPLFSLLSIIFIIYTSNLQINEIRRQINENKKSSERDTILSSIKEVTDTILDNTFGESGLHSILDDLTKHINSNTQGIKSIKHSKDYKVFEITLNNNNIIILGNFGLISSCLTIEKIIGQENFIKLIKQNPSSIFSAKINTIASSIPYFAAMVYMAIEKETPYFVMRYHISKIYNIAIKLHKWNLVTKDIIERLSIIQSAPTGLSDSVPLDIQKLLIEEGEQAVDKEIFKKENLIHILFDNNTMTHIFAFKIEGENSYLIRWDQYKWSWITSEQFQNKFGIKAEDAFKKTH